MSVVKATQLIKVEKGKKLENMGYFRKSPTWLINNVYNEVYPHATFQTRRVTVDEKDLVTEELELDRDVIHEIELSMVEEYMGEFNIETKMTTLLKLVLEEKIKSSKDLGKLLLNDVAEIDGHITLQGRIYLKDLGELNLDKISRDYQNELLRVVLGETTQVDTEVDVKEEETKIKVDATENEAEEVIEEPIVEPEEEVIEEPTVEPEEEVIEEPTVEPEEEVNEEPTVEPEEEVIEDTTVEPEEEVVEDSQLDGTDMLMDDIDLDGINLDFDEEDTTEQEELPLSTETTTESAKEDVADDIVGLDDINLDFDEDIVLGEEDTTVESDSTEEVSMDDIDLDSLDLDGIDFDDLDGI